MALLVVDRTSLYQTPPPSSVAREGTVGLAAAGTQWHLVSNTWTWTPSEAMMAIGGVLWLQVENDHAAT